MRVMCLIIIIAVLSFSVVKGISARFSLDGDGYVSTLTENIEETR